MRAEISSRKGQVVTAVGLRGAWIRLVQVRLAGGVERASVLAVKARRVEDSSEDSLAAILRELLRSLPIRTEQVVGLLPTAEILTRYLRLPAADPDELRAMAHYQMEGLLPFPIQECVTSVQVLGPAGEAVQVLAAAVRRPVVEQLTRICRKAGVFLSGIAASAEAIGSWHQLCVSPALKESVKVWLSAEISPEGLEIGILSGGALLYMRQVPVPAELEQMSERIKETLRTYVREQIGPPVERVVLGGSLENLGMAPLERLETALELPVQRVDPAESGPLKESLRSALQALEPEISFSDLLGAILSPRHLELDLLPVEARLERVRQSLSREIRGTAVLTLVALVGVGAWVGVRVGTTGWLLQKTQAEIQTVKPQAERVQAMVNSVRAVAQSRAEYAFLMECLAGGLGKVPAGVTLQFLGLEPDRTVTLRGSASDLGTLTRYAAALRTDVFWKEVQLRSAKVEAAGNGAEKVGFELFLKPVKER